jgi:hypothetical protein
MMNILFFRFVDGGDDQGNEDDLVVEDLEENNNSSCQRDLETQSS